MKTHEQQHQERRASQNKKVLQRLLSGATVTPDLAGDLYGCKRLGARIYDLKKLGYEIESKMVYMDGGIKYKEYYLKSTRLKSDIRKWLSSGRGITLESARYKIDPSITDTQFNTIIAELKNELPIEDDGYGRFTMNLNVPIL